MIPTLLLSAALAAPVLEVDGACPDGLSVAVSGASAGFAVLWGSGPGADAVELSCGVVGTGLAEARVRSRWSVPAMDLTPEIPDRACGWWVQVVDLGTCELSEAIPLDDTPRYVGAYAVADGPHWTADPVPLACVEACAEVFGLGDYVCSTSAFGVDRMSYVDGYGDDTHCTVPVPDTFVRGARTLCGWDGCYYSAWVDDHCDEDVINHCYRVR